VTDIFRLYRRGGAWKQAFLRLLAHDGMETAGFLSYTVLVSAFPFLIFLFSIASLFSGDAALQDLVAEGFNLLPPQVGNVLNPVVSDVLARPRPGLMTVGLIGALWAASSGVDALRHALNRAYGKTESRPWWRRRVDSAIAILAAAGTCVLVAVGLIALPALLKWTGLLFELPKQVIYGFNIGRFVIAFLILTSLFSAMYRFLPTPAARRVPFLPGAVLASLIWIVLAGCFSVYLYYFDNYSATYGSLGGVVMTLLFLQVSALVLLFGAEFNAVSVEITADGQIETR
jgi:membrane protein